MIYFHAQVKRNRGSAGKVIEIERIEIAPGFWKMEEYEVRPIIYSGGIGLIGMETKNVHPFPSPSLSIHILPP